jgi:FtsP/CotA-like multicopper oxidase with cupredoxin domain
MNAGWSIVYVMGSIWIVGMIMSITGLPFGKSFATSTPVAPKVASPPLAAPAVQVQPAVAPAPVAPAVQAPVAPKPTAQANGPAAHTSHAAVASTETKGNQLLQPRLEGGVKVFDVEAKVVRWEVLPGEFVEAWTYNGQVPGPLIRVAEGDKIKLNLKNSLPEATVVHFHGPMLPNSQDGVPEVTQPVVEPGQSFSYEFTAQPAGTFVYHTHHNSAVQEPKGLYGLFIVDPKEQRGPKPDREYFQVISELGGFFTINGKAFPATEPMLANVGERVLVRLVNLGQMAHPMHSHGHAFAIVATDGNPVQGPPLIKDTVNIAPGERYDLEITAKMPGTWVFHCHILSHVANKGVEPGGMISVFKIE